MATWSFSDGTSGHPTRKSNAYVMNRLVDYGAFTAGITDVVQALNIPANSIVLAAGVEIVEAETGAATAEVSLGLTGGDVDLWVPAATIAATGQMSRADSAAVAQEVHFAAADTLDLLGSVAAPTNAVLRVWAVVADIDGPSDTVVSATPTS